ncbi:hypothetical protein PDK35_02540 [Bacillus cereus group sp. TH153LC]|uniref:hypothetical protein n=1 Tax=Bacillus cereus group sp. TH153LC TaxID=3018059 RepID=UPI0022E5AD46|nr:hypothetical protein [Bacillus cereus group sp. TH153LC]MDA1658854.1 hypothetical protein [Bacillus cereus group sp. TH153LC]
MTKTKSQRIARIMLLSPKQKDLLIAGMLGVFDHLEQFPSSEVVARELITEVDSLLDKFEEMSS